MMLEHLGEERAAGAVMTALGETLKEGAVLTPDMGGTASTVELGEAVADRVAGTPVGSDGEHPNGSDGEAPNGSDGEAPNEEGPETNG